MTTLYISDPQHHHPGCSCRPSHWYRCLYCKRRVGWCNGADDEIERLIGPICDDCVAVCAETVVLETIGDAVFT